MAPVTPVMRACVKARKTVASPVDQCHALGMEIVIVDDTPLNLALMERLVGHQTNARPRGFAEPEKGLAWCLANEPDLIIVDFMMPGLDGLEFISQTRRRYPPEAVPILMVTANGERAVRYQALSRGASDFLTKPIDRHEFEPRVRNMLKLREAHILLRDRAALLAAEVRNATANIIERERETIMRLARAAEFRDPETGAHIQRMARYAALIAEGLSQPAEFVTELLLAAPMHDVGKLGIPDHILLKPGTLTDNERTIMKRHTTIGYDILKGSASRVVQLGASIALSHHEKYDGSGYPRQVAGRDIPLEGRIVAVADVFDALTSNRPYKKAWPLSRAIDLLRNGRGKHFDPDCVDVLLDNLERVLMIREEITDD